MKLSRNWGQRLAIAIISGAIAISGGVMSSPQSAQAATVSASTKVNHVISLGYHYLGTPYKFAAKSGQTRNFDCSSFTQYVFGRYGVHLPRTAAQQAHVGRYVSRSNWKRGDLLFFTVPGRRGIGHVAIYLGNNKMLHTYGKGGVKVTTINSYWKSHYVTARRVIN